MPERTRERELTSQFVIMHRPDVAGLVRAWASVRNEYVAAVLRDVIDAGLAVVVPGWIEANGGRDLDASTVLAHTLDSIKSERDRRAYAAAHGVPADRGSPVSVR
jgi:hypothetical protein